MKIYRVGGAVRDTLLGLTPKDVDYVVVGATPNQMLDLGYQQVGSSFPVFLHPLTGDEYALARTERKTGVGYNGFDVTFDTSVTLDEDLRRRDLTINSMAMDDDGVIIDPHGGLDDLRNGVLRHTSDAFAEDPVRVLRTARFAARYPQFYVHPDTVNLMRTIAPELAHVPKERIWAEFEKGLGESVPHNMMQVLDDAGVFDVDCMKPYSRWREYSAVLKTVIPTDSVPVRFALISRQFTSRDYNDYRIPTDAALCSKLLHEQVSNVIRYDRLTFEDRVSLLDTLSAWSSDHKLAALSDVMSLFTRTNDQHKQTYSTLIGDVKALREDIDTTSIASKCVDGRAIANAIRAARVDYLRTRSATTETYAYSTHD